MAIGGAVVFALGYLIFLTAARIGFSGTGISNRTAAAAALAASAIALAVIGWLGCLVAPALRRYAVPTGVAALGLAGFLTVNGQAPYWAEAWDRQKVVLQAIQQKFPSLPSHTVLLLHGVCPYSGPAIVFESSWDLAGALQVLYRDETLRANVTSANLSIGEEGVSTRLYPGGAGAFHPYGQSLVLFDFRHRAVVPLTDASTAVGYFGSHPQGPADCPQGTPGRGVTLLPLDRLYQSFEARGFRPWRLPE